jgi:hypothetical protein
MNAQLLQVVWWRRKMSVEKPCNGAISYTILRDGTYVLRCFSFYKLAGPPPKRFECKCVYIEGRMSSGRVWNTYRWSLASVEILGKRTWDRQVPGRYWDRSSQADCLGRSVATRAAGYRRRSSAPPSGCWARSVGSVRPVGHHRHRSSAWTVVRPLATRLSGRRPAAIQPPVRCRWSCTVVPRQLTHIHLAHIRDDQ